MTTPPNLMNSAVQPDRSNLVEASRMKSRWCCGLMLAALCVSGGLAQAGVGGGYTLAGLKGEYFANTNLTGNPAFSRRDVRLDFGLNSLPPGGAGKTGDARFRAVAATGFAVKWSGALIPRFGERYTFKALARDSFSLRLRPLGAADWTTVIDQSSPATEPVSGALDLAAGASYEVEAIFRQGEGPWAMRLSWSSPSTPEEVIDPLAESGINNPDWTSGFTDIVKGARNSWEPNGGPRPEMDADGWPMGDGACVFQESLNQGLDVDPLMRGRVTFSFRGSATVGLQGNIQSGSLSSSYDPARNLTTGSFVVINHGVNASFFRFSNSHRDGKPTGPAGITELRLMRPVAPDANTSHDAESTLFAPEMIAALSHFTVVRHQLVANQQRDWAERTRPGFFNQAGGSVTPAHHGVGEPSNNGLSWEHKILLANETGNDLMLSLPTVASGRSADEAESYIVKLAKLIRFGSDGVEPYDAPVADPVYPPLNPNLRVYLELENELWNFASVFYVDWANVNALVVADLESNHPDFQALNFDGLTLDKDGNGTYQSIYTWRYRKIVQRLFQISDIFRSTFGDEAMMTRVRPLYEWQYANDNDTARLALTFADRYYNNGDGLGHVANPKPVKHRLWGGGGATYYGAVNGNGLTTLVADPAFATPALNKPGLQTTPLGSSWTFTGTAGIARDGGEADEVPPPAVGSQMAFITDLGSMSTTVTFPTNFNSPIFGVSFKALNRTKSGASAPDRENLRVLLDGTIDITARTFSQGDGYTAAGYDAGYPWAANNVFWTRSEYYFTKSFQVEPGSTHTITFRGRGDTGNAAARDQTVFIGEVRVTSVDRIFEAGMPGGGEATGQSAGQNIQRTMNVEASWAKAFGLEQLSYEGGWSLGGDDGGSWVQLSAKYGDARTLEVQGKFMDMFHRAGSAVNVFGTYAQWPSWADYYAEQGLLDVGRYPIVRGIDQRGSQLRPEPENGILLPTVLKPVQATLTDGADSLGRITTAGGWVHWNVIAPRSGSYDLKLTAAAGGSAVLLVDDSPVGNGSGSGVVLLTKGLHSVKVRSQAKEVFQPLEIAVAGAGAPASPTLLGVIDGDGQATANWATVPGATQYQVRYGNETGVYTQVVDAGAATTLTVTGLENNRQYYFAVVAGNEAGLSLPSAEKGVIPLGAGQAGDLAVWEFNGRSGGERSAPVSSASARLVVGDLERGAGLRASDSDWAVGLRANRFASEPAGSQGNSYGAGLTQAIAKGQYYQFALKPVAGQMVSLSQLAFQLFIQNEAGSVGITYSTDGKTFSAGTPAVNQAGSSRWTVNLAGEAPLQKVGGTVTVRIYIHGAQAFTVTALGGAGPDLVVIGSLTPLSVALKIAARPVDMLQISWPATGGPTAEVEVRDSFQPGVPWRSLGVAPQLSGDQWTVLAPNEAGSRFFRLAQ